MNFHLVHDRGRVRKVDLPAAPDLTLDAPRVAQTYSGIERGKTRTFAERVHALANTHTGYRPGKLIDLGPDQCRHMAGDDGIACGAKGFPWCDHHREIVYSKGQTS